MGELRQKLTLFGKLVALILDCNWMKGLIVTITVKKSQVRKGLQRVRVKATVLEPTMDKVFGTALVF